MQPSEVPIVNLIHVLILHRKFELISIEIGFFTKFLICSKIGNFDQISAT